MPMQFLTLAVVTSVLQSISQLPILQISGDFLWLGIVFFVLAIIAAALGAQGVAGVTMTVAKWFVLIFLVLAILSILL